MCNPLYTFYTIHLPCEPAFLWIRTAAHYPIRMIEAWVNLNHLPKHFYGNREIGLCFIDMGSQDNSEMGKEEVGTEITEFLTADQ